MQNLLPFFIILQGLPVSRKVLNTFIIPWSRNTLLQSGYSTFGMMISIGVLPTRAGLPELLTGSSAPSATGWHNVCLTPGFLPRTGTGSSRSTASRCGIRRLQPSVHWWKQGMRSLKSSIFPACVTWQAWENPWIRKPWSGRKKFLVSRFLIPIGRPRPVRSWSPITREWKSNPAQWASLSPASLLPWWMPIPLNLLAKQEK